MSDNPMVCKVALVDNNTTKHMSVIKGTMGPIF